MGLGLSAKFLFLRTLMMEYYIYTAIGITAEGLALLLNPFVVSTCLLILLNATQRLRGSRTSQQIRFTNIGGFLNNKYVFLVNQHYFYLSGFNIMWRFNIWSINVLPFFI